MGDLNSKLKTACGNTDGGTRIDRLVQPHSTHSSDLSLMLRIIYKSISITTTLSLNMLRDKQKKKSPKQDAVNKDRKLTAAVNEKMEKLPLLQLNS